MTATVQSDPSSDEFALLTDQFRPELLAHCYRMLGSVQDAEDQVQETLLRAWRGYGSFEGRSSLRTWLYRIATNACLRAMENRERRPLPSGLGAPGDDPAGQVAPPSPEVTWLEPFPDALLRPAELPGTRSGRQGRTAAAGGRCSPVRAGRRWSRSGTTRSAAMPAPRSRRRTARHGSWSPAPGLPHRGPSPACGSSAPATQAGTDR